MNSKGAVTLSLLFLIPLLLSINADASTLRIIINGPSEAQVWIYCPDGFFFVTYSSTTLNFNGSIKVEVCPANPGYYVIVNGTKVFYPNAYTITISKSETLYVDVKPVYVRLNFNFENPGCLEVTLYNGSAIKIYHSTYILVPKDSINIISSLYCFIINGTTEVAYFPYTCIPADNMTLNIKFIVQNPLPSPSTEQSSSPSPPLNVSLIKQMIPHFRSQDLLGIGILLLLIPFYIFFSISFKRKRDHYT